MCCLSYVIWKWLDILVFSDKDEKPFAPSPASSLYWLAGDVKELTHLSQRVGNVAPSVVVWLVYWKLGVSVRLFPAQFCKIDPAKVPWGVVNQTMCVCITVIKNVNAGRSCWQSSASELIWSTATSPIEVKKRLKSLSTILSSLLNDPRLADFFGKQNRTVVQNWLELLGSLLIWSSLNTCSADLISLLTSCLRFIKANHASMLLFLQPIFRHQSLVCTW